MSCYHAGDLSSHIYDLFTAFSTSGGYFNPVLATGLKFGCKGHTNIEHGIVYWIGSSLGAVSSVYVYPVIRNAIGIKPKTE